MYYFTSDWHLGHNNIIRFMDRPFSDIDKMQEALIANWNNTVQHKDIVYILGDFCVDNDGKRAFETLSKLKGRKILIKGNHDEYLKDKNYDWSQVFEEIGDYYELNYQKRKYVLFHYPIYSWEKIHKGNSYHLHGHMHIKDNADHYVDDKIGKIYDVGVDANNYFPISIDGIMEFFNQYSSGRIIGKTVKVVIDRPIGSKHPQHDNIIYPINYGYVKNVYAGDSENQDCYIIGVDTPMSSFTGQVIAVIHRQNDSEDKWVVAPHGKKFSIHEIKKAVHFQEKYFDIEILI